MRNKSMSEAPKLEEYPLRSNEKLRYADTDRLGHTNNTVYPMLFETGHVELLYGDRAPKLESGCAFVIARLVIEFVGEAHLPGTVEIGTRVSKLGQSSVDLEQAMFQDGRCVATAKSVIVLFDGVGHRSRPLPSPVVQHLSAFEARARETSESR
jgi:acyl-CoA thioester hydrolase